eukprot:TRINITY_DN12603_c0_g2_i6.p1 TRINITY_DN12603_c0_g2~~TRINITY_DN12603_c0_g2_i6.p1  ORF type:complete len:861 (-),score=192.83 TRINITY_DN12603_c0_g2_i6:26-2365(-)
MVQPIYILPGVNVSFSSPDDRVGYYELSCFSSFRSRPAGMDDLIMPHREIGEAWNVGFAIMKTEQRQTTMTKMGFFNLVDISDPHVPSLGKQLSWDYYTPSQWSGQIDALSDKDKYILGQIAHTSKHTGVPWESDPSDDVALGSQQRDRLLNELQLYFTNYAVGRYGEAAYISLGDSEDMKEMFTQSKYFTNLRDKVDLARECAYHVQASNLKFIYSTNVGYQPYTWDNTRTFINSVAFSGFDILGLIVYPWPDFPSPESFLPSLLAEVSSWLLGEGKPTMPIWITEAGIPVNDPPLPDFADAGNKIQGTSRYGAASYCVKFFVVSLSLGVERVLFKEYRNPASDRLEAQANFGTRDHEGYPLPSYPALINAQRLLDSAEHLYSSSLSDVIRFTFSTRQTYIHIMWLESAPYDRTSSVPFSFMKEREKTLSSVDHIVSCSDMTAHPCSNDTVRDMLIYVGETPLILITKRVEIESSSSSSTIATPTSSTTVSSSYDITSMTSSSTSSSSSASSLLATSTTTSSRSPSTPLVDIPPVPVVASIGPSPSSLFTNITVTRSSGEALATISIPISVINQTSSSPTNLTISIHPVLSSSLDSYGRATWSSSSPSVSSTTSSSSSLSWKDKIVSSVLNITLVSRAYVPVTALASPIAIIFTIDENQLTPELCLGYINETTRLWECEDRLLVLVGPRSVRGYTTHLTSFAIIVDPQHVDSAKQQKALTGANEVDPPPKMNIYAIIFPVIGAIMLGVGLAAYMQHRKRKARSQGAPIHLKDKSTTAS